MASVECHAQHAPPRVRKQPYPVDHIGGGSCNCIWGRAFLTLRSISNSVSFAILAAHLFLVGGGGNANAARRPVARTVCTRRGVSQAIKSFLGAALDGAVRKGAALIIRSELDSAAMALGWGNMVRNSTKGVSWLCPLTSLSAVDKRELVPSLPTVR